MNTKPQGKKDEKVEFTNFFELHLKNWDLFSSRTLRGSRIVLMSDLTPAIDFFNSGEVGIGARSVQQTVSELNIPPEEQERLSRLIRLRSYDIYTLRAALAGHLTEEEIDKMVLPQSERRQLEEYTRDYTRALFRLIFDKKDASVAAADRHSMKEVLDGTSEEIVRKNVMELSRKFCIRPDQLVDYIASIGDMLLAISFYRRSFEQKLPEINQFLEQVEGIGRDRTLKYRHAGIGRRTALMAKLGELTISKLNQYFQSINAIGAIWDGITPERFRILHDEMEVQYPKIGRILCIWQIKLSHWRGRFCDREGRPRDSTMDQKATFFSDRVYPKFDTIEEDLKSIKDLNELFTNLELLETEDFAPAAPDSAEGEGDGSEAAGHAG